MLLASVHHNGSYLYLPNPKEDGTYSYKELIDIAGSYNVILNGYRFDKDADIHLITKFPFIVSIIKDNLKHAIIIRKIKKNKVYISDPAKGNFVIDINTLLKKWNKTALVIKSSSVYKLKSKSNITIASKRKIAILLLLHVLVTVSLLAFIYFLKDGIHFVIPISLLTCFVILEIVYRLFSLRIIKEFDNKYMSRVVYNSHDGYEAGLESITKYKELSIAFPLNYLTTFISAILVIIIMSLNNMYYLCIAVFFAFIAVIYHLLIKPTIEKKKREVEKSEAALINSRKSSYDTFNKTLTGIRNKSYLLAKEYLIYKYLVAFLSAASCLLIMALSKEASFNYLFFYYVSLYYLCECFDKMLSIAKVKNDYQLAKLVIVNAYARKDK